jgi:hypothetical protein
MIAQSVELGSGELARARPLERIVGCRPRGAFPLGDGGDPSQARSRSGRELPVDLGPDRSTRE